MFLLNTPFLFFYPHDYLSPLAELQHPQEAPSPGIDPDSPKRPVVKTTVRAFLSVALFVSGIRPTHQHTPKGSFTLPHWFSHPGNLWTRKQSCPFPGNWLQNIKVRSTIVHLVLPHLPTRKRHSTSQEPVFIVRSQHAKFPAFICWSLNLIWQVGCWGSIVEGDPVSDARTSCAFLMWPFHKQGSRLNFYIGSTGTPNFFIKVHQHLI